MRTLVGISSIAALAVSGSVVLYSHEATTLERVRATGIVRIAYTNEPPHSWRTNEGRVTGESPEVARHVLHAMGVDSIEWVWSPFRSIFLELRSGRVDLVAAGAYITPERARDVRFTRPTIVVPTALLIRAADTSWLRSLEALAARDGARIAILAGSVERELALRAGIAEQRFVIVPDPEAAHAAVLAGRVDAFAASIVSARGLRAQDADSLRLAVARAVPPGSPLEALGVFQSALVVRLEDDEFARALDQQLTAWLGSPDHLALLARLGLERDLAPVKQP